MKIRISLSHLRMQSACEPSDNEHHGYIYVELARDCVRMAWLGKNGMSFIAAVVWSAELFFPVEAGFDLLSLRNIIILCYCLDRIWIEYNNGFDFVSLAVTDLADD